MSSGVLGSLHCSSLYIGTLPRPLALHFLLSAGCLLCLEYLLLLGLRPLPEDSLCALWLLAHLLWPSLRPRFCESSSLSNWFLPFRGPTPISRLFVSLRPCRSRSPIPSLAPSRWGPCTLRRWAYLTLSGYVLSVPSAFSLHRSRLSIPFALSPLSRHVFASSSSCGGASPHALGSVGAHGVRSGSTYIALHRSWSVSAILQYAYWSSGRCFILNCAMFRMYSWRSICRFNWLMRVQA